MGIAFTQRGERSPTYPAASSIQTLTVRMTKSDHTEECLWEPGTQTAHGGCKNSCGSEESPDACRRLVPLALQGRSIRISVLLTGIIARV